MVTISSHGVDGAEPLPSLAPDQIMIALGTDPSLVLDDVGLHQLWLTFQDSYPASPGWLDLILPTIHSPANRGSDRYEVEFAQIRLTVKSPSPESIAIELQPLVDRADASSITLACEIGEFTESAQKFGFLYRELARIVLASATLQTLRDFARSEFEASITGQQTLTWGILEADSAARIKGVSLWAMIDSYFLFEQCGPPSPSVIDGQFNALASVLVRCGAHDEALGLDLAAGINAAVAEYYEGSLDEY